MLTRNFYSIYCMPRKNAMPQAEELDRGSSEYMIAKTVNNKIAVSYLGNASPSKYEEVQTTDNSYAYDYMLEPNTNYNVSTKTEALNLDKNDKGTTQTPSSIFDDNCGYGLIFLGNGTTAPTYDDVCMESCITAYNRNSISRNILNTNNMFTISMQFTPTENIEVQEIGLYSCTRRSYNFTTRDGWNIQKLILMIGHKVLPSPVTFEAGKTYTIDYTIDFKNMTDSVGGV